MIVGLCYDGGAVLLDISEILGFRHQKVGRCPFFHVFISAIPYVSSIVLTDWKVKGKVLSPLRDRAGTLVQGHARRHRRSLRVRLALYGKGRRPRRGPGTGHFTSPLPQILKRTSPAKTAGLAHRSTRAAATRRKAPDARHSLTRGSHPSHGNRPAIHVPGEDARSQDHGATSKLAVL